MVFKTTVIMGTVPAYVDERSGTSKAPSPGVIPMISKPAANKWILNEQNYGLNNCSYERPHVQFIIFIICILSIINQKSLKVKNQKSSKFVLSDNFSFLQAYCQTIKSAIQKRQCQPPKTRTENKIAKYPYQSAITLILVKSPTFPPLFYQGPNNMNKIMENGQGDPEYCGSSGRKLEKCF